MPDPGVGLRLETCAELVFLDDRHATPSSRIDEHEQVASCSQLAARSHALAAALTTRRLLERALGPALQDMPMTALLLRALSQVTRAEPQVQPDMVVRISGLMPSAAAIALACLPLDTRASC